MSGQLVALSDQMGRGLLNSAWPVANVQAVMAMDRGERYMISRRIAYVPITGLLTPNSELLERYLGWTTYRGLEETMSDLVAHEDVAAIVLIIDSPGGLVLGLDGAVQAIAGAASAKPVHAVAHPLAASAAYALASQATELSVTPGSMVGSIGCAVLTESFVQPGQSWGVQMFELVSSHAMAKRPDASTEEGRAEWKRSLDESEARFHAVVAAGRGIPLSDLPDRLSVNGDPAWGGAMHEPEDAVARGLADQIETRAAFDARIIDLYGSGTTGTTSPRRRRAQAVVAQARAAQARASF